MLSWQELELFWRQLERRGTGKKQVLRVRRRAVRTTRSSVVMTRGRPHAKRPIRKIYTKRDHKPPIAGKRMRAHARIRLCIKAPLKVGQILFFWCPSSFSKWFSSEKWCDDISVARIFSSEIADFSPIYRQIRQLFGPKSRKIRQFLAIYSGKIDPLSPKFRVLLHFYALIFFKMEKTGFF